MATKKQERDRQRRRHEKVSAATAKRAADQDRLRIVGTIVAVIVVLCLILWWAGSTFSSVDAKAPTLTATGCEAPPRPLGTTAKLSLPGKAEAQGKTFEAVVTTNCGDIVIGLDGSVAPQAVASFVQLARTDYWLNAPCHRLVRSTDMTLLQCGDPTGTGQGDPGYGFGVENAPTDGVYERGVVAMARTPDAQKGNGGQFFLVTGRTTIPDTHGYTRFGTVTAGLDILDKIVAAGVAGGAQETDGAPSAPISILRVAVTEKKAQP